MQPSPTSQPLVLVVDDDLDIRECLREVLHEAGFAVAEAWNGSEALTYLRANPPPAVILLDLFMPVMDGWELERRLQADPALARIPLFVLTATGSYWGYPAGRVFHKPIQVAALLQALREAAPAEHPPGRS
jgi:CheY-like chemotaxis protein